MTGGIMGGEIVRREPEALARRGHEPAGLFQPDALGGAMSLAKQLAQSTLIPKALQGKPGDVLVVLLTGKEFGLGPMQALRGIHVVEGKAVMAADLMVGLCAARREVCAFFTLVESTARKATYRAQRVGSPEPVTMTWTIDQAQAAGLASKHNWKAYPEAMLRARCASALARVVFPDLLAGTYDPEELEQPAAMTPAPPTPTRMAESIPRQEPQERREESASERWAKRDGETPLDEKELAAMGPHKSRPLSSLSLGELGETYSAGMDGIQEDEARVKQGLAAGVDAVPSKWVGEVKRKIGVVLRWKELREREESAKGATP